mgnify:CR=1 FL=1
MNKILHQGVGTECPRRASTHGQKGTERAVITETKGRTLFRGMRRIRRVLMGVDAAMTVVPVISWVALIAISVVVIVRAARRSAQPPMVGPGDDKPPGYENPTPDDIARRGSAAAP